MPLIKSAKKKLRKDRKRTKHNSVIKLNVKKLIKAAKTLKKEDAVIRATQAIDKAVKNHIFHKNKAGRIKSILSKLTSEAKPKEIIKSSKKLKNSSK